MQLSDSPLQNFHLSFENFVLCILLCSDAGYHFTWGLSKFSKMCGRSSGALWRIIDKINSNKLPWLNVAWWLVAGISKRRHHFYHINRRRYWRILHFEETILVFKYWSMPGSLMWVNFVLARWNFSWNFVGWYDDLFTFGMVKTSLFNGKRSFRLIMRVCGDWVAFITSA